MGIAPFGAGSLERCNLVMHDVCLLFSDMTFLGLPPSGYRLKFCTQFSCPNVCYIPAKGTEKLIQNFCCKASRKKISEIWELYNDVNASPLHLVQR
jgi:hypothetical protein